MNELPFLLLVLLIFAVVLRLDFIFYLLYLGTGTYALARWWTARSLPRLRVTRHFDDHAFLNQAVPVTIRVENTSLMPIPWLRVDETMPTNLSAGGALRQVLALRPRERAEFTYKLSGWRRGYYPVGPAMLTTGDLFGFAEAHARTLDSDHLTVYPRVIPLVSVDLNCRSPYGTIRSQQRIYVDPARAAGKREYHPGDPLRTIDWKSSAHTRTLQVKKFDPSVSLHSMVYLNLNRTEYALQTSFQVSEWAIVVAASLTSYLALARQAVGLASNGQDLLSGRTQWMIAPRTGRQHLMNLLEWLARVEMAEGAPFVGWLPTATLGLAWGTTVIVVTPQGSEPICSQLHQLVRRGLNPVLVTTEPHYGFSAVRARARQLGFAAHQIAGEHDLEAWRT